jgi:hypothetical protein
MSAVYNFQGLPRFSEFGNSPTPSGVILCIVSLAIWFRCLRNAEAGRWGLFGLWLVALLFASELHLLTYSRASLLGLVAASGVVATRLRRGGLGVLLLAILSVCAAFTPSSLERIASIAHTDPAPPVKNRLGSIERGQDVAC